MNVNSGFEQMSNVVIFPGKTVCRKKLTNKKVLSTNDTPSLFLYIIYEECSCLFTQVCIQMLASTDSALLLRPKTRQEAVLMQNMNQDIELFSNVISATRASLTQNNKKICSLMK